MSFHINKSIRKCGDLARNYMWEVFIPDIATVSNGAINAEDFVLRCRNVVIPARGNEPIETFFLGMKQLFPGKPIFTNTMILMLEEFEDQKIMKAIYQWQENIFSVDPKSDHAGSAKFDHKSKYTADMLLRLYKQTGEDNELDKMIRVVNCWPSNVDDVTLDYTAQESIKHTLTLTFDWWTLEDSSK